MPDFFGPFSRSAFLVNKKSLFLRKCQCIKLLTVFQDVNISPPLFPYSESAFLTGLNMIICFIFLLTFKVS